MLQTESMMQTENRCSRKMLYKADSKEEQRVFDLKNLRF